MPVLAEAIKSKLLKFGSDRTYTNMRRNTYDPALLEQIKELGRFIIIKGLVEKVLGWSPYKIKFVLKQTVSISYGCISENDANLINEEIIKIYDFLTRRELVSYDENTEKEELLPENKTTVEKPVYTDNSTIMQPLVYTSISYINTVE